MIDPEIAAWDELIGVSRELTPADLMEISAALKAHKAKQAHSKKTRPLPATRKNAKAAAK